MKFLHDKVLKFHKGLVLTAKVKTVIGCYFLLPDSKSRGHPSPRGDWPIRQRIIKLSDLHNNQQVYQAIDLQSQGFLQ